MINKTIDDNIKKLAQNIGISFTNLLFISELALLLFFEKFNYSKLNIKTTMYKDITKQIYIFLYNSNVVVGFALILCISLLLNFVPISNLEDGYPKNTSRGFYCGAAFPKLFTIFIYYIHDIWIYAVAALMITGNVISFKALASLSNISNFLLGFNILYFIISLFYVNISTFDYTHSIELDDYLILNKNNKYALVKNSSYTDPLFLLVELNQTGDKGSIIVYSSGFAEVKYAFDNVQNLTNTPKPISTSPAPHLSFSERRKFSMVKK